MVSLVPFRRTMQRSVNRGVILLMPSSTAFWMMKSILSPLAMPCARVRLSFDSLGFWDFVRI